MGRCHPDARFATIPIVNYPTFGLATALLVPGASAHITRQFVANVVRPGVSWISAGGFDGLQDMGQGVARVYRVLSLSSNSTAHPSNNPLYWHLGSTGVFEY